MIHFRLRYETVRDTLAALRALQRHLRAAWRAGALLALALLVTALAARASGEALPPSAWAAVALASLLVGCASWLRDRVRDARQTSPAWLDAQLGLGELLVTAVEVDRRGPRSGLERLLLDDAATALAERADARALRGDRVRREVEAVIAVALVVLGVACAWGWLRGLPPVVALEPLGLYGRATGDGSGLGAGPGPGAPRDPSLDALSEVWADHAALRPAAMALERAQPNEAARALRSLADRAPELSEAGARDLAEALDEAAQRYGELGGVPEVAEAIADAGRSLRQETSADQTEALERLARALEREAAAPGQAPGTRAGGGREREGPPAQRLAARPSELPLPNDEAQRGGGVSSGSGDARDAVASEDEGGPALAGEAEAPSDRESAGAAGTDASSTAHPLAPSPQLEPAEREIAARYFERRRGPGAAQRAPEPAPANREAP